MEVTFKTNAAEFRRTLAEYSRFVRKTPQEVIEAKARDVSFALFRAFGEGVQASAPRINSAAAARGWISRRRGNGLSPADPSGVSVASMKLARRMLGGEASGFFKVGLGNAGSPSLRFARFSKKGKLLKGKKGRTLGDLSESARERAEEAGGFKRLNLRAVSLALEASMRTRAALGGTMRAQWLPKGWRRRGKGPVPRGTFLEARNDNGKVLGQVAVGDEMVTLTALVGETERVGMKSGVFSRALAEVRADMLVYIRRKLDEAAARATRAAARAAIADTK